MGGRYRGPRRRPRRRGGRLGVVRRRLDRGRRDGRGHHRAARGRRWRRGIGARPRRRAGGVCPGTGARPAARYDGGRVAARRDRGDRRGPGGGRGRWHRSRPVAHLGRDPGRHGRGRLGRPGSDPPAARRDRRRHRVVVRRARRPGRRRAPRVAGPLPPVRHGPGRPAARRRRRRTRADRRPPASHRPDPRRGRGRGGRALVPRHRRRVRRRPRAVRPEDRGLPGGQAPVRGDARDRRVGDRGRLGRGVRCLRRRRAVGLRRRAWPGWSPSTARSGGAVLHPGPRWDRLHLRARRPPLPAARPHPAEPAGPGRRRSPARSPGARSGGSRRDGRGRPRGPRRRRPRRGARASGRRHRRAARGRAARGPGGVGLPGAALARALRRRAPTPVSQLVIDEELARGRGDAPRPEDRRLGGADDHRPRHRRAARAVRPADAARRDDLVPAVQRARRRVRPGLAAHPRGDRSTVAGGSPGQKVWTSLAQQADWAHLPGPHRPRGAAARGHHLLPRRHDQRRASTSGRCAR